MTRILVALALWSPLVVAACCTPTRIDRPIIVRPPSCLPGPAPLAPDRLDGEDDDRYMLRFARWYALDLSSWIVEVERACAGPVTATTDDVPWQAGYP